MLCQGHAGSKAAGQRQGLIKSSIRSRKARTSQRKKAEVVKHFLTNIITLSAFLLIFAPCRGKGFPTTDMICAQMVESVDTRDLKSLGHYGCTGSSPVPGTINEDLEHRPATYTTMSWDDFVQSQAYDSNDMPEDDWLQYMEQLEWLHSHPMDINRATPEEMALLPFLTPAQIESLQAYIHLDGPMKSLGELALIPSLDFQTRQVLPLFFYVSSWKKASADTLKKEKWFTDMHHSADTRMDIPLYYRRGYQTGAYRGNPLYHRMRYTMESRHLSIGARAEKDPGEGFYDSYGGYAMIRDCGIVQKAIIGDFRVGWGEGLVMGRGSYFGKSNMMNSPSESISPMTGMMESGFLRGMAFTFGRPINKNSERQSFSSGKHRFSFSGTIFASYQAIDATLTDNGDVRTIVTGGYHRTKTELEKRRNTHTALVGAHLQAELGHFRIGATGYWQHFDRILSPGEESYRRWYPRGKDFGIIGLHGGYSSYRWTASAEVAYSTNHGGVATLGRAQWLVNRNLKLGILGRYYSHKYHSFQAASVAENSSVQNETGAMFRMEARPWNRLFLTAYADFFADYWPRYGMTTSSSGQELMAEARWEATDRHALSLRYQMKRKAARDVISPRHKLRAQWTYLPSGRWKLQSTAYANLSPAAAPGFGFSQLVQGKMLPNEALRLGLMAGYFHATDYDTRIYLYEPALWNSTSASTSYYGHGLRLIAMLRYTFPGAHWTVEARYAITHMLQGNSIASGLQEILSPTRQDISVQVRMAY